MLRHISMIQTDLHDDVIKWKHFPRYQLFLRWMHRIPVNSPHKGQWRGALMFSLICVWINSWVNNGEAGDLRRYRAHYDVIVMRCGLRQKHKPDTDTSVLLMLEGHWGLGGTVLVWTNSVVHMYATPVGVPSLIASFVGPTWGPPGPKREIYFCRATVCARHGICHRWSRICHSTNSAKSQ